MTTRYEAQVAAVHQTLSDSIGGHLDDIAEQVVTAVRRVQTGPWEIRYRRFRDPEGTASVWAFGTRAEMLEEFIDVTTSGPFANVGRMA